MPASDNPNYPIFPPGSDVSAQPIRDGLGAPILGPQNVQLQQQNPDLIAPPTTDHGSVYVLPLFLTGKRTDSEWRLEKMRSGPSLSVAIVSRQVAGPDNRMVGRLLSDPLRPSITT